MTVAAGRRPVSLHTIFALREADGWSLHVEEGQFELLPLRERSGPAGEVRLVKHAFFSSIDPYRTACQYALAMGWSRLQVADRWLPMDEPFPLQSATVLHAQDFQLRVDHVLLDDVCWSLKVDQTSTSGRIECPFDDLLLWVRFLRALADGGCAHATLGLSPWDPARTFVATEALRRDACRFYMCHHDQEDRQVEIDVMLPTAKLLGGFRSFLRAVGDHPLFAHEWIAGASRPDHVIDPIWDAAAEIWNTGVAEGRYPDDPMLQAEFAAYRLAEKVPLSAEAIASAEKWRTVLRTLQIPAEWE